MAEELDAQLSLDVSDALAAIENLGGTLDSSLTDSAATFADAMASAIGGLPDVVIDPDVSSVEPAISGAVDGADTTVAVEATGTDAITADITDAVSGADSVVALGVDLGDVDSTLASLEAEVSGLDLTAPVEVDTSDAQGALDDLGTSATEAGGGLDTASHSAEGFGSATGIAATAAGLAVGETGHLQSTVAEMSGTMKTAVGVGGAFATTLGVLFHEGLAAESATQRFHATLGALADEMERIDVGTLDEDFGKLATDMGSTRSELEQTAANLDQFAKSSGATNAGAERFSETLIALASRAVALRPSLGSVSDVAQQMSARLARGGRFVAQWNISLTSAQIVTEALAETGKSAASELTQYDKVVAAATLSTQKYGDVLGGDVSKGAQNAELRWRALQAQLKDTLETLGAPTVSPLIDLFQSSLPTVASFGRIVADVGKSALPLLGAALSIVAPPMQLLADIFDALPGPVTTAATAVALLGVAFQHFNIDVAEAATSLPLVGGSLEGVTAQAQGATGWLAANKGALIGVGAGALLAASNFDEMGKSTSSTVQGIAGFALAGGSLGFMLGGPLAAGLGAAAGGVVGLGVTLIKGQGSVSDYRKEFAKLGEDIAKAKPNDALKKFIDHLGDTDKAAAGLSHFRSAYQQLAETGTTDVSSNIHALDDEIRTLAENSPAAAEKVMAGFRRMNDEGKLAPGVFDSMSAAVAKGTKHFEDAQVAADKAASANDRVRTAALSAAVATTTLAEGTRGFTAEQTNASGALTAGIVAWDRYTAGTLSAADAAKAVQAAQEQLGTAILSGNTQMASGVLSIMQAKAANDEYVASVEASLTPQIDAATGARNYAAEQAASATASTNAAGAEDRYASGTLSSKEATDLLSASVNSLKSSLDLLLGNFVSQEAAQLDYGNAIDKVNASLAGGSTEVGTFSASARDNAGALLDATTKATQWSESIAQAGGTTAEQLVPLQLLRGELGNVQGTLAAAGADTTWVDNLIGTVDGAITNVQARQGPMNAAGFAVGTGGTEGMSLGLEPTPGIADAQMGAAVTAANAHVGPALGAGSAVGGGMSAGLNVGAGGMPVYAAQHTAEAIAAAIAQGGGAYGAGHGIGEQIGQGLGDGIGSKLGHVVSSAVSIVGAAIEAAANAAGVHSPSRVMMEIGGYMSEGLALGMEKGARDVAYSAASMMGRAAVAPIMPGVGAGTTNNTALSFNINVSGVTSPATGRAVGEQIGKGAADALARRGVIVSARTG